MPKCVSQASHFVRLDANLFRALLSSYTDRLQTCPTVLLQRRGRAAFQIQPAHYSNAEALLRSSVQTVAALSELRPRPIAIRSIALERVFRIPRSRTHKSSVDAAIPEVVRLRLRPGSRSPGFESRPYVAGGLRNSTRRILPLVVLGSSTTNSNSRGYL